MIFIHCNGQTPLLVLLDIRAVIDSFSQSSHYHYPFVFNCAIRYRAKTVKRTVEILSLPDSRIIHICINAATCLDSGERGKVEEFYSWLSLDCL